LQTAISTAVGLKTDGLDQVRTPVDKAKPAYRRVKHDLRELYQHSHFEREGRWGRLSVLRFDTKKAELTLVASMESASDIGRAVVPDDLVYRAVARREAVVDDTPDENADWLTAYAPLSVVEFIGSVPKDKPKKKAAPAK